MHGVRHSPLFYYVTLAVSTYHSFLPSHSATQGQCLHNNRIHVRFDVRYVIVRGRDERARALSKKNHSSLTSACRQIYLGISGPGM